MIKISICDDSPQQLEHIYSATEAYFNIHANCKIQIDIHKSSLLFLEHLEQNGGCDIALLDICMPGILGTQVAKEIRRRHDKTEIVFLTTSDEYAVDAFQLKAAHYLLKPFSKAEFDEAMDRAMTCFAARKPKTIVIKSENGELHNVEIGEILYIESRDHGLTVTTKTTVFTESRRSLTRILEELEALSRGQFISPYKGYIVNQKAILTIERENIVMKNRVKIPIPKRGYKVLQDRYMDYIFEANRAGGEVKE